MAVIENDVIKVTVSNSGTKNVIRVSPGVAALASVSLSLNDLNNVDTSGITNGQTIVYDNGSFVAGDSGAVETINGEAPDINGDVVIDFSVDGLSDVSVTTPSTGDILKYETNRWVNDSLGKADVDLANVDNTSDASKPISTATQTALDTKANTSSVPTTLNDLSDVVISVTPSKNQALVYDDTSGAFKSLPNFTNRFEDEAEINKQGIIPFSERVYTVKADGDGIFIDAESDTPTAGKVIVRKIYHKTGFITDADVIGDYTLIHTFADDTAYADTVATFEGFEDGATYGVPPFTLLQTWEEVTAAPSFTGLLNETYGSGAEAAYSTRRLNGNVTDCMVIRRASDSTTTTIGFDTEGNIDEAAINTFCSGTSCTVYQWIDQSGNGNTATAAAQANEPTIYTGGALVKDNENVALDFSSGALSLDATISNQSQPFSFYNVFQYNTTSYSAKRFLSTENNQVNRARTFSISDNYISSGTALAFGVEGWADLNQVQETLIYDGSNSIVRGSGSQMVTGNSGTNSTGVTIKIGARQDGAQDFDGLAQEIILYSGSKSASDRTSVEENQGDYFTQNTPLLDTYSGAAAAYSLRLLDSTYTGALVEVYNGSSYADIYSNVFGELDTVALAAHCGSNDGFVSRWYDQSGNANHATQTTTANMPKIYDGTTGVITESGKPSMDMSTGLCQLYYNSVLLSQPLSFFMAGNNGTQNYAAWFDSYNDTTNRVLFFDGSLPIRYLQAPTQLSYTSTNNLYALRSVFVNSTNSSIYFNGSQKATGDAGTNSMTFGRIGNFNASNGTQLKNLQEFIVYDSDQSSNRTNIEDNINTFYSIY
jgi:hypothetical protein